MATEEKPTINPSEEMQKPSETKTMILSEKPPPNEGSNLEKKLSPNRIIQQRSRLEEQINFEHLKLLEKAFREGDKKKSGKLGLETFRRAIKTAMGSDLCDRELEVLFMKVDTDCDGLIDWDEYISYMLLDYQGKAKMNDLIKEIPFPQPLRELRSNHKDFVVRIIFLQNLINRSGYKASDAENPNGKFLALSRDGELGIYTIDYTLVKTLHTRHTHDTALGSWVTDMAACSNVSLIAISSSEREISFFDISGMKLERKHQIVAFKDPIITLDYSFNYDDLNESTLVASDSFGNIIVFRFFQALKNGLFGSSLHTGVVRKTTVLALIKQKIEGSRCLVFENIHSNLVNCAHYFQLAQGTECFISCCASSNDSMYLGDLTNISYKPSWPGFSKKSPSRNTSYTVKRGILALDYSKEWNLIVTGSFDGVVRTWNPGNNNPVSLIKSHHNPVNHILIIQRMGQVITSARDRTLKVFELKDNTTHQTVPSRIFSFMGPAHHVISAMYYHRKTKALLLGAMKLGVLEGSDYYVSTPSVIRSHSGSVSKVLYNKLFEQVVTASHDSSISVWDFHTGVKLIQFQVDNGVEITTMSFDETERKLIVGCRNGSLSVWNFNNGSCLKVLSKENGQEITGIICSKKKVLTAGWSRKIKVYTDPLREGSRYKIKEEEWDAVHIDDILSLSAFYHANGAPIVASCSYDGNILIWSLNSGDILCYLNKANSYSPISTNGITKEKNFKDGTNRLNTADRRGAIVSSCSHRNCDCRTPLLELLENPSLLGEKLNALLNESNNGATNKSGSSIKTSKKPSSMTQHRLKSDSFNSTSRSRLTIPSSLHLSRHRRSQQSQHSRSRINQRSSSNNEVERLTPPPHVLHHKLKSKKNIYLTPSSGQDGDKHNLSVSEVYDEASSDRSGLSGDILLSPMATPSSGRSNHSMKIKLTASEHTRKQVNALTGESKSAYWEAETSITQVLFLETRPHTANIATLFASGGIGWVYAWSVHPRGGLLGQFVGAHNEGEIILSLATDTNNEYLFTGDSVGYIKVWKITEYCNKKSKRDKAFRDLLQIQLKTHVMSKKEREFLSTTRQNRLRRHPPEIKVYFRAHIKAINSIGVISDKEMFVSGCVDGTVRLWTLSGLFVGTFGQKRAWNIEFPKEGLRMPNEVRRVGSANTLKTLNAGYSSWTRAKKLIKLAVQRIRKDQENQLSEGDEESDFSINVVKKADEAELEYKRITEELPRSKILGHSYKPTRKHRILPKIKVKTTYKNFHVHSSLKFSALEEMKSISVPEILKEKWRMQKQAAESEQRQRIKRLSGGNRAKLNRWYFRNKESSNIPTNTTSTPTQKMFPKIK